MTERSETRILGVEDSAVWRSILTDILTEAGLSFEIVEDADTALDKLGADETKFTGIITDGLNGDWVRVVEAAGSIPVVVISVGEQAILGAEERGISAFSKEQLSSPEILQSMIEAIAPE